MSNAHPTKIWGQASLRITDAARLELLALMRQLEPLRPIACVSWALDAMHDEGGNIRHRGPHWGIGFYSPDQVLAESVVEISGIPFVFAADDAVRLDGATLDVLEEAFVVNERSL